MRRSRVGWLFVGPAFLHLIAFAIFPMAFAFAVSLDHFSLIRPQDGRFTGFGNYGTAFAEPSFWNAMWNSFRYAAVSVPTGMFVALLVAVLVSRPLRGVTIFRTLYYIPAISSGVAISMIWIWIYLPDTGMLNSMMGSLFGPKAPLSPLLGLLHIHPYASIDFLNRTAWAMWALCFMSIWTGLGPRMILFLAGLLNIPQALYEAAELDGATGSKAFWKVTIPMLAPTTLFVLITSSIGAMQIFTPIYMMTKGAPDDTTDVIGYHIYTEAWVNFNTGLAAAKSFVLLAVIVAISIFQVRLMRGQLSGYSAG